MDRAAARAHRIDHRHPGRGDVVAVAHPAGIAPADVEAEIGAAALHKIEQARGAGIDWLGRTIEAAMHVDTDVALCRDIGARPVHPGPHPPALVAALGAVGCATGRAWR